VPHVRKQIRDAIAVALTGLATTAGRVSANRSYTIPDTPAIRIMNAAEGSEYTSSNGGVRTRNRVSGYGIECHAQGSDADDTLDQIALEVETALEADPTLGGLSKDLYLISSEPEWSGDADQQSGKLTLTYDVLYLTAEGSPGVAL